MNHETMLLEQHFDNAFAAPDGIQKLRELILTLAMQGKLVPQDPNDQPASELLKKIKIEKQNLIAAGNSKIFKPLPIIKQEEIPFELPNSWQWARFGDLVQVINGKAYKQNELLDIGTPVLRVGNLFTSKHWYYSDLLLDEDKRITTGDLIYAWSASFGPFIWDGGEVIYHYHIWKLKFFLSEIPSKKYLYNYLLEATEKIKASGNGIAMIHMTKERMEKLLVPVPPLAEQHRIVAKIDQLMARCDELEKLRSDRTHALITVHTAAIAHLLTAQDSGDFNTAWRFITQHFGELYSVKETVAELRKTILQLAVMGKLVPQDPNDEPASELLKVIELEKQRLVKEGKIKPSKPSPVISAEEIPHELPKNWVWARLGEISLFSDSGWSPQCLSEPRSGQEWGILKVSAVSWGEFRHDENKALPPGIEAKPECEVRVGDFLMSRANTEDLVARSVIVKESPIHLMMSDKIVRFSLSNKIEKEFINLANSSKFSREYYAQNASGTSSSMKNISREVMNNLPIPLPPLAEQHRIVAKVDQLMALCDRLEDAIVSTQTKQTDLLNAVMSQT